MSVLKFNISWDEDNAIYRDIEVLTHQTFYELHECLKKVFQFPENMEGSFYMSDDHWTKGKEISSTVEKNLRDAPALSMKKTPIGALMNDPHQRFVYECVHPKAWTLLLDVISLSNTEQSKINYPHCTKSEGLSPSQIGVHNKEKDPVMETLEMFDLAGDEDGYGNEGEDEISAEDDFTDSNFTEDL